MINPHQTPSGDRPKRQAWATKRGRPIYLSFGLGLRAKEMAALKVRDVMQPSGELRDELVLGRQATKGGKVRLVYLTQTALRKALTRYLADRKEQEGILFNPDSALLKSQKGGSFTPTPCNSYLSGCTRQRDQWRVQPFWAADVLPT